MFKLEEGEKIEKVLRRHWLVVLPMTLIIFVATIFPIFLYKLLLSNLIVFSQDFISQVSVFVGEWKLFGYSVWLLILWVAFFIEWTDYYLDLWVVTNKRIIDVEQKGFFHREVTSFNYNQIQDITVETRGFIRTILKFGDLHIQTAGHSREIIIRDAYDPEGARALVLRMQKGATLNQ